MDRPRNVLFLCTGNSARSILAEALLNRMGKGRFTAYSAGSHPKGEVHPAALALLGQRGFTTKGLRSKSWDEFARADSPQIDFVITVCDNAAGEVCPIWVGGPMKAHWGIDDPAAIEGPGQSEAFARAMRRLESRIGAFLAIPKDAPDLASRVRLIGSSHD